MTAADDPEQLKKQIAYYRKRADELAAENLQKEYSVSSLKHQLTQKRQGFALLSELSRAVSGVKEADAILALVSQGIERILQMHKVVVLLPGKEAGTFTPHAWIGFPPEAKERLATAELKFPPELLNGKAPLLVKRTTPGDPLVDTLRALFQLDFFLCGAVPDGVPGSPALAVLVYGREKENRPSSQEADESDLDTLASITGLAGAAIRNMKISVLEELDKVKTEFFANISHEFRTPITLTLGPLEGLLQGRHGEIPPPAKEQLELMRRNQQRLLTLINQILDLAKLESGKMQLKAAKAQDPNELVRQTVAQFGTMAEQRGITLSANLGEDARAADLYVERDKFDKVLFNLLSNAHKFTPRGGKIEVRTWVENGAFKLAVADTGMGIREDQVNNLFQRFQQAEGSASKEYAGTGIGLAFVKELVELHKGTIGVQSRYGHGTTFTVSLPTGRAHLEPSQIAEGEVIAAAPTDGASRAQPIAVVETSRSGQSTDEHNQQTEARRDPRRPTVLYVDDNPEVRAYVGGLLSAEYNLFLGVDGEDGLERARRYKPDLILSDLMMPKVNGVEFCQRVRADSQLRVLPFVLLTARSSLDSKVEGLEEGADDYLPKPFNERELLARVRNLVLLRQSQVKLKRELKAAQEVQRAFLPGASASFDGARIDAVYHPAEELGGDFYDWWRAGEWLYFYVADVTSHGTAAAQVTYLVKQLFRRLFHEGTQHGEPPALDALLTAAQKGYAEYKLGYDTAYQLGRLHLPSGRLELARASAPNPVRVAEQKPTSVPVLPGSSLTSGEAAPSYPVQTLTLAAKESLFLFTDGSYEFETNGKELGARGLMRLLGPLPDEGFGEKLLGQLSELNGSASFEDDVTVLRLARS